MRACVQRILAGKTVASEDTIDSALLPLILLGKHNVWSLLGDEIRERKDQVK